MRHALRLAAFAAGGLLAAGATAPAALAADDCPNAAVRAQQGVSHLPNCMAYEKLTPTNKNGAPIGADFLLSDDGNQAWVYSAASIIPGTRSGLATELLATRGENGWSLESLLDLPAYSDRRNTYTGDYPQVYGVEGMRRILYTSTAPLDPDDVGGGSMMSDTDIYVRESDGTHRWLTKPEGITYAPQDPTGELDIFKASPDFSKVIFGGTRIMNPAVDPVERGHLWLRQEGKPYELIDRMPDGSPSTATRTQLLRTAPALLSKTTFISPDLSSAVWIARERVNFVNVDTLWVRAGIGTPQARTLKVGESADGSTSCTTSVGFMGMTLDGRYVHFSCGSPLTADALPTGGAYARDTQTGAVIYDVQAGDLGPTVTDPSEITSWTRPDGTYRVERRADLSQWSINLRTGDEKCVTCFDGGVALTSVSGGFGNAATGGIGASNRNFITPEGDVFFTSTQQLVPEDTNAFRDLYVSIDGKPHLLSGGDAGRDIQMGGISLDGSTASFMTTSTLLDEDRDGGAPDVYVLRRNGGFLRTEPPAPCSAGCQGPAVPVNALTAPLSVSFPDVGDLVDEGSDPIAVSGSRTVRGTSVKLKVSVPAKGRVTASGSGLRATSKAASKASTVTVTVKLSERSQRTLRRKGSTKVKASVRFVPADGATQSKRVNLTFRKPASKKKGSSRSVAAAPSGKAAR